MNSFITTFDPRVVIEELRQLIQVVTDILSNPQLLDVVDGLYKVLEQVNAELGTFSFKPATDAVVEAIGIVEGVLEIASSLPLPDSVRSELEAALRALPPSLAPITGEITGGFESLINEGPKPILSEIKEGPARLIDVVQGYSPEQLIGDELSRPYTEFLDSMVAFRPSELLRPVQEALDGLKTQLNQAANPAQFLQPLEEPFDELMGLLDQFNPQELIQPLQEQLQSGIHSITEHLPLEETDAVFDQIGEITARIAQVVAAGLEFRNLVQTFNAQMAGLADGESQIQDLSNEIASKIDQVSDISELSDAASEVEGALDSIMAAPLQQVVETPLDTLIAKLDDMQTSTRLVDLVTAQRGFPRRELDALPGSPEKSAILALLEGFDPLDESFTVPLNALHTWRAELDVAKTDLASFFADWDDRYHGAQSPLTELRRPDLSAAEIKTLLSETLQREFSELFAPIFKVMNHFQDMFNALFSELFALLDALQATVADFLAIADSLQDLRGAINRLVQTLEDFDISFIATEIQSLFDGLKLKLGLFHPARIAAIVGRAFDDLLSLLDVNELLGADQLDRNYAGLLEILEDLNPGTLVTDLVQPEFDKILVFLARFDLSAPIDTFLALLDTLGQELETELTQTAEAYESMMNAVPSGVSSGAAVSAGVAGGAG